MKVTQAESEMPLSLAVLWTYPALVFGAQLCGLHALAWSGIPIFFSLFSVCGLLDVISRRHRIMAAKGNFFGGVFCCVVGIMIFLWIMSPTDVVPAFDAIAVPAFARLFVDLGFVPDVVGPEHRVPLIYPPGFPMLLADLFKMSPPLTIVILFKYLCVVAVGVTPFTWAWACRRLFMEDSCSMLLLGVGMLIGFLTFDRTLMYALPIAGKNAQLFQSALIPIFFVYLVSVKRLGSCIVMALCCSGMFLIHYSALYVTSLLLGAWSCVHLKRAKGFRSCVRPWGIFLVGVVLFLPRGLHASKNSASVAIGSGEYVGFNWDLLSVVTTEFNNFVFIFNEIGLPWPYKGACSVGVLGLAAGCLLALRYRRRNGSSRLPGDGGISAAFWFCVISWLSSALLAYGMLPVPGINLDFTRWFSYNFLSAAIGMSVVIVWLLLSRSKLGYAVAIGAFGYGLWNTIDDVNGARGWIKDHAFPIKDLQKLARALPTTKPCQVVTRNGGLGAFMYQVPREAEYIPVLSGCEVISGSYIAPDSYGLDVDGSPTPEFLTKRHSVGPMYFLGKPKDAKRLRDRYLSSGVVLQHIRSVGNLGLWRIRVPALEAVGGSGAG